MIISVKQAARLLNISEVRVRVLIRTKRLPAERIGWAWVIEERNLELVKDRRPGNPNYLKR